MDETPSVANAPGGRTVLVQFDDGIAWVTMNRPEKRNAISPALAAEMLEVVEALETDDRCRVLVLTGAGEAFSAGMDLKEYFRDTDHLAVEARAQILRTNARWQWKQLRYYPKPTIAMVNGWCFGGAFNPVAACDLAVAAEEAKFGLSEINWGIIPAGNVLKSVSALMSERDMIYYTMTGRTFDGRQAAEMGFVNEATPAASLRGHVEALARLLMEKNPTALRTAKHACRRVAGMSWEDAEDFLFAKLDQLRMLDPEKGRETGMREFLDEKTYRPGLGAFRREV